MGVHIPSTNNYDFKDWIKCKIKWSLCYDQCLHFIQLKQLPFHTPFMFSFKLYSQMLIQYCIFSLASLYLDFLPQVSQGLSLPWLLKVKQFIFLHFSGSSTHRSLASLQTLPALLLFLLVIWHNLMALAASCFPFYHLRCFGYSAINIDYSIHSWFN